jgi:hypothetical protein
MVDIPLDVCISIVGLRVFLFDVTSLRISQVFLGFSCN